LVGDGYHKRQVILLKLTSPKAIVQVEDSNILTLRLKGYAQDGAKRVSDHAVGFGQLGVLRSIGREYRSPFTPDTLDNRSAGLKGPTIDISELEVTTEADLQLVCSLVYQQ
jgi:hypothetical protein